MIANLPARDFFTECYFVKDVQEVRCFQPWLEVIALYNFLGKLLHFHSVSHHPGTLMNTYKQTKVNVDNVKFLCP